MTTPQADSLLERLPAELLRQILSCLDLEDLGAIVRASPLIHQLYLLNQSFLLRVCIANTDTLDAHAVHLSNSPEFLRTRSYEMVTLFMEAYQDQQDRPLQALLDRSPPVQPPIFTQITQEGAKEILSFRSSVIRPLMQSYTEWALGNLPCETGDHEQYRALSDIEETRLMRAFYRFQLTCNLFMTNRSRTRPATEFHFRHSFLSIPLQRFSRLLEPWEIDEIICIYEFAKAKFGQILSDIRSDVHVDNGRFADQGPRTPDGAFDLDSSCEFTSLKPDITA